MWTISRVSKVKMRTVWWSAEALLSVDMDKIPVPRKRLWIFCSLNTRSWAATKAPVHSTFCKREIPVRKIDSNFDAMTFFKAPNTPMSNDWVKWEECGGRIIICILWFNIMFDKVAGNMTVVSITDQHSICSSCFFSSCRFKTLLQSF